MIREIKYDEVFDSQKHFRLLMECMSRPGKLNYIESAEVNAPEGINQATVLAGFALMNSEVSFYLDHYTTDIEEYLKVNTSAVSVPLQEADFVYMRGDCTGNFLSDAKTGSDIYPETAAFILLDLSAISKQRLFPGVKIVLAGPGVDVTETIYVQGLGESLLNIIEKQNSNYPLGFDFILTSSDNIVCCIPRSSKIHWEMNH